MRFFNGTFLVLFLFPCIHLRAQDDRIDTSFVRKIRQEALQNSQIDKIAYSLTDLSGGRLTNSPAYKRAATWAVNALKQWGISQASLENYGEFGKGWEVEKCYVALKFPYYQNVIGYSIPYTGSTKGLVTAPVILVDENDSAFVAKNATQIKNKIVFLTSADTLMRAVARTYPTRYSDSTLSVMGDTYMYTREVLEGYMNYVARQNRVLEMMRKAGAIAFIRKSHGRDGTVFVDATAGYKKNDPVGIPEIMLSSEDFLKLRRLAKSTGKLQLELDVKTRFYTDDLNGYNVIAEIPGTDPVLKDEVVMLGGHLDSWQSATGATDNAAGCAVMMEVMRVLKKLNLQPRRTIRIALWGGEEQALIGSFNYVKNNFGDPNTMQLKPAHARISAYYNLDNGSGKIRGIFAQNNEGVVPVFKKWLAPFADLGASTVTLSNTGSTDHFSFDAVGIPGFQFIQDPLEYETRTHHSNMDSYDHLALNDLKQATVIVAAFVYNTAMRDEKLPRKPLPKAQKWLFEGF